jgi:hypothetical protein
VIAVDCAFPACREIAITDAGMCDDHRKVRVHPSFVDDKHADKGHG